MNRNQKNRPFRAMALYSAVLAQLAGSMIAGIFAGLALDNHFNTVPLFLIIGLLGGLSAGIYAMLRTIQHFNSGD
ncbi:AtpZ/AtpI family protein [Domibacillus sp. A3M-37]|jgi:ATP synthase protein I|uniref:AtpZ/AtpI family protein n=1 Tax=Domibacillus TaxID=1433999 RepID=UPI0006180582|nr:MULTISPECIES: AtpZ/AtpI family protein [Domibacillus]MCP3761477.1 AtpZ/AtpI family protein [Domibacillus sp. A3M-37]